MSEEIKQKSEPLKKILPCPFCGKKPIIELDGVGSYYGIAKDYCVYIHCEKCSLMFGINDDIYCINDYDKVPLDKINKIKNKLIDKWNKRKQ